MENTRKRKSVRFSGIDSDSEEPPSMPLAPRIGTSQTVSNSQTPRVETSQNASNSQTPRAGISQAGSNPQTPRVGTSQTASNSQTPRVGLSQTVSNSQIPRAGISQTGCNPQIHRRIEAALASVHIMDPVPLERRRHRRMRVRETMESTNGPWDKEREELIAYANKLARFESTRLQIIRSKKENLTATEVEVIEELKRQDERRAKSEERWEEELKNNSGLIKSVTKIKRRNSIRKTLKQEKIAYEAVKDNLKTQARDAECEVDREYLRKKEMDYEIKRLWEAEATRWEMELEIPTLLRKSGLPTEERDYLNISIGNSYVHKRWCMAGPVDREPWSYRNNERKMVCEDCRADEIWNNRMQESSELPGTPLQVVNPLV
ncbi:uncharacterized protein EAE98_006123 [Botrytis deweyae]|uniref:Uncharacterized protein n=1 Tax=Botrytis deweyae TaxID=2478750 RepID=A0ABQ7IM61_9HELO|nr:uncharacterized protein EAE98_006123 [Botrytis deweyae]KAF7927741.1 hypothetical protein EAE98_006123 [Botrytis deweyae]